jgi:hypothetical protein
MHGPVLLHDRVRLILGLSQLRGRQRHASKIDRRILSAHMETDGLKTEQIGKHSGQQMLSGVLLHVIEAAGPMYRALYLALRQRHCQHVDDAISVVDHFDYVDSVNRT